MAAVRMCARSVLRHRVWGAVVVVVLVGVAGGAVLGAVAGARRTESAYPRLLEGLRTADVTILPRQFQEVDADAIARLPNVVQSGAISGFGLDVRGKGGDAATTLNAAALAGTDRVAFNEIERLDLLDGRMPNPGTVDEVLLNDTAARASHFRVGSVLRGALFNVTEVSNAKPGTDRASLFTPVTLRVVGVGRNPDELLANENIDEARIVLTPAFEHRYHGRASYRAFAVRLRHGSRDVPAFQSALHRRYPNVQFELQTLDSRTSTFTQAVQPYTDALWLFAAVAAVAALFVVGQALVRLVVADGADGLRLDALGATRPQRATVAASRATAVVLAGGAVAVLVAAAASPLLPLGPARRAEPEPGFRIDGLVLVGGFGVLVIALAMPVAIMAWRLAKRSRLDTTAERRWVPSRAAERLARSGAPASAVSGVRFALQRDRRPGSASVVTTLLGLVVAIGTIAAALTFGTSLDRLVTTPQRYGWTWDALVDTYDSGASPKLIDSIRDDRDLSAVTVGRRGTIRLAGRATPAFGFEPLRGGLLPQVTEGRFPTRAAEIALGAQTLRDVDRSVGDTIPAIAADGSHVRLRVVGQVVLPSLSLNGTYGIGEGVALTAPGVLALDRRTEPSFFLVDLERNATIREIDHRYRATASALGPQRPGDIIAYARVRSTPLVLAGLLALLGIGVLAHMLVASVRARRRDLAILKTIGFARRQVMATVAWQATTLGALAVMVGVPVGLVAGRTLWHGFATDLGVGAGIVVPVALLMIAAASVLLANLIAALPATTAARTHAAVVLRSE